MSGQITGADHLIQFCRKEHEELLNGLDNKTAWSKEADLGYGNQVVSAAHDERTVLELIQNARDAIIEGNEDGRVSVIVGPDSLIVANTGSPFQLNKEDVFRAVTSLGRSAKAQNRGSIGEKGVGLKSVLQLSEQFSIYSQVKSEQLSAHFSRARTTRMLLSTYGNLLGQQSFRRRLAAASDGTLIDICRSLASELDNGAIPNHLDIDTVQSRLLESKEEPPSPGDFLSDLPRLSLFRYPFADSSPKDNSPLCSNLVGTDNEDLTATNQFGSELRSWMNQQSGSFTTVVELDYVDTEWQTLLDRVNDSLANTNDEALSTFQDRRSSTTTDTESSSRQEELWQECTAISPETLILLGHIKQLDLVRVTREVDDTLRMEEHHQIEVDQGDATRLSTAPTISRQPVTYTVKGSGSGDPLNNGSSTCTREFRQYTQVVSDLTDNKKAQSSDEINLLFEKPPSRDDWAPKSKPLYLYYPIEEVETPFPFVVHAPFRVGFDRQSLADDEQNNRILDELPDFVANAAVDLARGESSTDPPNTESFAQWMPWLVMPLESTDSNESKVVAAAIENTLNQLHQKPIVPTDTGEPRMPTEVLCDPKRLRAFEPLRRNVPEIPIPGRMIIDSGILWRDSGFGTGDNGASDFRDRAARLGLTNVLDRPFDDDSGRGCIDLLCEHWGTTTGSGRVTDWAVTVDDVQQAREYFESVCNVLRSASDEEELNIESGSIAKQAAEQLGRNRVPLLPAEAHQDYNDKGTPAITHLVRARSRHVGDEGRGASRSERIVFRRGGGDQSDRSIISELPTPPSELPVFVVPFRSDWTGPLEGFNREWGTRKLDSPAEFYRRVAAEAGGYSGDATDDPNIIGYLDNLYETVTRGQIADWLRPMPHRHHQFGELQETLKGGKTGKLPSDYDDYLERRYVQQVRLPIADADTKIEPSDPDPSRSDIQTRPAEELSFGTEWAKEFEAVADTLETEGTEADRFEGSDINENSRASSFRRWAAAIRLASESAADSVNEVAPPDDDYWTDVFGKAGASSSLNRIQQLDFLIHLGVQVGPRIEWRWTLPTRGDHDRAAGTITVSEAQTLAEGKLSEETNFRPPRGLVKEYRDIIWRSDNNPAFSATHSTGCGDNWLETAVTDGIDEQPGGALLPMWWYFPDLPNDESVAAQRYRDATLLMWPELSDGVAELAWLCSNWHSFSTAADSKIPSLGLVQLARHRLWPAEGMFEEDPGNDRLTVRDGDCFQAQRLILHDGDQLRGAVQYLPRVDIEALERCLADAVDTDTVDTDVIDVSSALRSVGIQSLDALTPSMAAERLEWFLSQFKRREVVHEEKAAGTEGRSFPVTATWSTQALSVPKDALMRRLVDDDALSSRLDDRDLKRRWIRRDLYHLGTCIPITEGNESKVLHIGRDWPPKKDTDAVIFTRPISKYSRDRLVSDGRRFVERPTDETELAHTLGDAEDTVNFGITTETNPPSPRPVHGASVEIESERLKKLQSRLRDRQEYLLASYLEQATAPDLQSVHDDLSSVFENPIGVVNRENNHDARRNSAKWQPTADNSSSHIALFRDSLERYQDDGGEIPLYLAADGLVQVVEQFDLRDTFENVLFKNESTLEDEYSDALEDVRREVAELRTQRLEDVFQTLDGLASTLDSNVSLPSPEGFDVDPRPTLAAARMAINDEEVTDNNPLLESWYGRLTNECGLDKDSAAHCLVAATTDDHETQHRITYRLAREGVLNLDELIETGHRWERLNAWPHSSTTRPVESYVAAVDRVRRFWWGLDENEDEGEAAIERAVRDTVNLSHVPYPHRRVATLVRDNGVLGADLQELRLGDLPYVSIEPTAVNRLVDAVMEWIEQERTGLQEFDVVYKDPDIDDFFEDLIEAVSGPDVAKERVKTVLKTYCSQEGQSSSESGTSRSDLTMDWIRNDDDDVKRISSEFTPAVEVTNGASPDIGESSGGGYSHVNAEIDARGREGELICLDRAWNRFRGLPRDVRKDILDSVEEWRGHEDWRLNSVDDVASSFSDLVFGEKQPSGDPKELLEASNLEATPEEKAAFHALFDTSAERGPGFDLVDPFAAMPDDEDPVNWNSMWMRRVEAKAVDSRRIHNGRIKLTGNELRMALRHGPMNTKINAVNCPDDRQYLVRLVGFPTNWRETEDVGESVQLFDIENVTRFVGVDDQSTTILEKLRGGSFYITFRT